MDKRPTILVPDAARAAERCFADAVSWGCEPQDALRSAIVEYLEAGNLAGSGVGCHDFVRGMMEAHRLIVGLMLEPYTPPLFSTKRIERARVFDRVSTAIFARVSREVENLE